MRRKQSGFTLVEIAIVLVIVGLLLVGVLKGQELINSAKVKNMAADLRNVPVMIYAYQDKFRRLPGDDNAAAANVRAAHQGDGNGVINGKWNEIDPGKESVMFWEHVRLANLASGSTNFTGSDASAVVPTNAEGGRIGVSGEKPLTTLAGAGSYVCSDGIDGKFARPIDLMLDDGVSDSGALQGIAQIDGRTAADGASAATAHDRNNPAGYVDGTRYTLCLSV